MILLNTTFACDTLLEQEVTRWIQNTYVPAAIQSQMFSRCTVCRIFPLPDADASSIAVQMLCASEHDVDKWQNGQGAELIAGLSYGRPDRVMAFSTIMEVLYECD